MHEIFVGHKKKFDSDFIICEFDVKFINPDEELYPNIGLTQRSKTVKITTPTSNVDFNSPARYVKVNQKFKYVTNFFTQIKQLLKQLIPK